MTPRERSRQALERSLRGCQGTAPYVAGSIASRPDPAEVGRIKNALRRLSSKERAILLAVRLEGCSYPEIAGRMGLSVPEVEQLLATAFAEYLRNLEQPSRHWWRRWQYWAR